MTTAPPSPSAAFAAACEAARYPDMDASLPCVWPVCELTCKGRGALRGEIDARPALSRPVTPRNLALAAACEAAHEYPHATNTAPCSWPACKLTCKGRDHRLSANAALDVLTAERDALAARVKWQPIETAPRDGTLLRLLIGPDERENALEDTADESVSIGFNNCDHDGEDVWKFAGWCWSHDHFTEGHGTPTRWAPLILHPET